jgi:hypothetical protein
MNPQAQYRLELLAESVEISGQLLLIRLHLKTVSPYEFSRLNIRADYLRKLIQETKT